jgi:uncharacterized protein (DUF488 family)
MPQSPLYTIGYAPHEPDSFADILRRHGVTAVVDVRSSPWSAYKPEFGRKRLEAWLPEAGIRYVWLGEVLGPRWKDPAVHSGGRPDYELIARHPAFRRGLERLRRIMDGSTTAIMCAEKEPLDCHRTLLVARRMKDHADIRHILADGSVEPHREIERRLTNMFESDRHILPGVSAPVDLDAAYRLKEKSFS